MPYSFWFRIFPKTKNPKPIKISIQGIPFLSPRS